MVRAEVEEPTFHAAQQAAEFKGADAAQRDHRVAGLADRPGFLFHACKPGRMRQVRPRVATDLVGGGLLERRMGDVEVMVARLKLPGDSPSIHESVRGNL